ncbi:MAG: fimbria/pilus periplasmic chaperone [Bacteroidales bacterium]|nr:fimbria/pilus periplasmic chaperone [Bacteroidales bacterium]
MNQTCNQWLSRCNRQLMRLSFLALTGILLMPLWASAQGNLLITPRRIVFEGNQSAQEINLANTGQDTAVYSVSFVQYQMNEDGSFTEIDVPAEGQLFADKFLRYFPRTVTLAPGEAQMVRMQLRRTSDFTDGEYRSHLYFRAVPQERPLGLDDELTDTTAIGIRITPIFGITIPVIIRSGDLEANVTIDNMSLEPITDSTATLHLTFNRTGNRSVFGDITVDYDPASGKTTQVGLVRGVAVYTPNQRRDFKMELKYPAGFKGGKLVVKYSGAEENDKNMLAEKAMIVE